MAPRGPRLHKATQGPAEVGSGGRGGPRARGQPPKGQQSSHRAERGAAVWDRGSGLGSGSDMGPGNLETPVLAFMYRPRINNGEQLSREYAVS